MRTMTQIRETIRRKQEARIAKEIAKGKTTSIIIREARTILANLEAGK